MAIPIIKSHDDEILDVKKQSLYARLKRLFSTDTIVRNVGGKQLKMKDTDNIQYATDRNSLRDRFNRIRSTAYNSYSRDFSLSYQAARMDLFRDYDTMDMDPIMSAAMDIFSDECVHGDTIIPLLNGEKIKIEDLFNQKRSNFWVYSLDENGNFKPEKCERVALNGKKQMYKVILDDGTEIKCTSNHQWITSDGNLIATSELKQGTSLKVIKTKISSNKFMPGYEMLLENGKWKYTHRLVANNISDLIKERDCMNSNDRVIHHLSFNKLNNDPSKLKWMNWKEHRILHANYNKELWSNPTIANEYKEKIRLAHKRYWTPEKRLAQAEKQKKFMENFIPTLTQSQKNQMFGLPGIKNGMYKSGYKLSKNKNGRWIDDVNRPENIDINLYESDILSGFSTSKLKKKYNILRTDCNNLNRLICEKYKTKRIDNIKYKLMGYSSAREYQSSNNHRVVSICLDGEYNAYDLVNVGNSTHLYAIETKDGSKLYTHNCLTYNEMGKILTVHCANSSVKGILENLYNEILNISFNMWSWTRNMCKYGDFFLKLSISPEYGVYMVEPISAYNVERIENSDPYNKRYVKFQIRPSDTTQAEICENYEMAHFRLISDSNFLPYGKSVLEGGRRCWKQLSLMEDAMLIHRIMRAPEKRIFYTDIGNIPPAEVDNFLEKQVAKLKKIPYMDEKTGEYNLRFNLQNMTEDYFIPVRGGDSGTRIDTLGGMEWTGTEDIEYIKNKLMAALKIPKAFLGYEEGISGKASLATLDVRFARTIQRIQKILCNELEKIGIIHLYAQGYRDEALVDFKLELTNPSTIFEKEKIQIFQDKTDLAERMSETKFFPKDWIYKNIYNLSDDDSKKLKDQVIEDAKQSYRLAQIENDGDDPASSFKKIGGHGDKGGSKGPGSHGGSGGLGGGSGGSGGMGGDDLDLDDMGDDNSDEHGEGLPHGDHDNKGEDNQNSEKTDDVKTGGLDDLVKESTIERDQTGRKDVDDYPFGEDPLGSKENSEKSNKNSEGERKSEIRVNPEIRTKLEESNTKSSDTSELINSLSNSSLSKFMNKSSRDITKELLSEAKSEGVQTISESEKNIIT